MKKRISGAYFLFALLFYLRSCLKLYRQVFYRARIECLFIFKGRIAGYVTAKKKETGIIEHEKRRNYQLL
ncbi:MAG: hypothetical protein J6V00_08725 [Bacteroidaceae bacterium]|nr:hypothetical protein [Bacteroidaceae bacterium]